MNTYLKLMIKDIPVAFSTEHVAGIERLDKLRPPRTGIEELGSIPFHGAACSVLHAGLALNVTNPTIEPSSQIVMIRTELGIIGVIADRVLPFVRSVRETIAPLPIGFQNRERDLYRGVLLGEETCVPIVDPIALANGLPGESERCPTATRPIGRPSDSILLFDSRPLAGSSTRNVMFGIPAGIVVEIIEPNATTPVAPNPGGIVALTKYRGKPLGIVDLALRTGLTSRSSEPRRAIVVAYPEGHMSFRAGQHISMRPTTRPHIPSRREWALNQSYVRHVIEFQNESVVIPEIAL